MKELVPICVIGIITWGIYRLFELYARRQERLELIERMSFGTNKQPLPPNWDGLPFSRPMSWMWSLRTALLLMGIGLGLIIGLIAEINLTDTLKDVYANSGRWHVSSNIGTIYFASITFFGGLGLLVSYLIESNKEKTKASKTKEG